MDARRSLGRQHGATPVAGRVAATGGRPPADVRAGTPLFSKIESWVALGAPPELLSPLLVLRVVYPVSALLWCVEAAWLRWPGERGGWVYVIAGAAVVVWASLLVAKQLSAPWCHALAGLGTVLVAGLVWAGHGPGAALGFVPFFLPMLVFVALFLSGRAVLVHLALAAVLLWLALWPAVGGGYAAVVAAVAAVAAATAPLAVMVLARVAGRSGAVDPDTGLPNAVGLARRFLPDGGYAPFLLATVLLAGVDEAREALGHEVGSELLRRAAENLSQVLPDDTLVVRVGGDELVVGCVLPGNGVDGAEKVTGTTAEGRPGRAGGGSRRASPGVVPARVRTVGHALAGSLVDAVAGGQYVVGRVEVSLRAHVGLAFAPWDGNDLAELVRRASLAARQAAASGRAEVVWDHPEGTLTAEDLTLLADLRLAAERGELHLAFQPQVESRTGRTVSAEALLRWRSDTHGDVPAGRVIVLAERTGYIDHLTEWILCEALDAQVRWRRAGVMVQVAMNLSAKTLRRPDLPTWILGELDVRSLPPEALGVEVTETAAAELLPAVQLLQPLHERGVRVSIDDFGTGYTSLAALPHLPLDEIKVDMSFVLRSGGSPADEAIVRSVLDLAHRLGLAAVAEGVEDDDIRRRMTDLGYDLLQGYHISEPLPEDQLLDFARSSGCATIDG